jgi:hypothetical protein
LNKKDHFWRFITNSSGHPGLKNAHFLAKTFSKIITLVPLTGVAVHGGQHEGRDAELAPGPGVDLGAVGQQQLDDVHVATGRRQGQGGVIGDVSESAGGKTVKFRS